MEWQKYLVYRDERGSRIRFGCKVCEQEPRSKKTRTEIPEPYWLQFLQLMTHFGHWFFDSKKNRARGWFTWRPPRVMRERERVSWIAKNRLFRPIWMKLVQQFCCRCYGKGEILALCSRIGSQTQPEQKHASPLFFLLFTAGSEVDCLHSSLPGNPFTGCIVFLEGFWVLGRLRTSGERSCWRALGVHSSLLVSVPGISAALDFSANSFLWLIRAFFCFIKSIAANWPLLPFLEETILDLRSFFVVLPCILRSAGLHQQPVCLLLINSHACSPLALSCHQINSGQSCLVRSS